MRTRQKQSRIDQHFAQLEGEYAAAEERAVSKQKAIDEGRLLDLDSSGHATKPARRSSGGSGNSLSGVLYYRHCSVCGRQWRRTTIKATATEKRRIKLKPVCQCNADYVERRGAAQQMGASSSGAGGGVKSKRRAAAPKPLTEVCVDGDPQTKDVDVCTICGGAIDKLQEARAILLQPALWEFVRKSKAKGLKLRDIIAFLTCTPYFTRDQLNEISVQIEYYKSQRPGDQLGSGTQLFGTWPARRDSERILLSVERACERLGVRVEAEADRENSEATDAFPELRQPTLRDVGNLACAVYLEHVRLLRGTGFGIAPGVEIPEIGIEALVASDPDECLALCDMIVDGDARLKLLHPYRSSKKVKPEKIAIEHLKGGPDSKDRPVRVLRSPIERLCNELVKRKDALQRRATRLKRRAEKARGKLPVTQAERDCEFYERQKNIREEGSEGLDSLAS